MKKALLLIIAFLALASCNTRSKDIQEAARPVGTPDDLKTDALEAAADSIRDAVEAAGDKMEASPDSTSTRQEAAPTGG
ncbi:hypothetical protein [Hymenobacter metallilatus]|uniref:YtxH domain-containing protein n=1 Tax=Hymenobacter metallilatus TaxID=2493666 RepID=A0A428JDA0_9BACT|nr:hypothetical protein [Hymenobacter metallilatus]RSK30121.1 hypothetical protein EI290_14800 [Hymenobacter metallilatus]